MKFDEKNNWIGRLMTGKVTVIMTVSLTVSMNDSYSVKNSECFSECDGKSE